MREKVSEFAGKVAAKGPDTVALVFYAGHGLQIDGENFLVPIDVDPKREADIPMQAVRLNDILNTLTSVPSKMRILLLDACRNNPFPELNKTAGRGLAIVDAKIGAPGTFLSFSTSPGAEAEDGNGANSPYTTALLAAAKEPNIPIEETFKRVRVAVNKATDGRQTPWDSSSLTEDFRFLGRSGRRSEACGAAKKTVDEWKRDLKGKPVEAANELIVADGTDESYEAFAALYAQTPRGLQARDWLDRHRRMVAWNNAVHHQHRGRLSRLPRAIPRQRSHRDRAQAGRAAAQPSRRRRRPLPPPAPPCRRTSHCGADLSVQLRSRHAAPLKKVDTPEEARRAGSAEARRRNAAGGAVSDEDEVVVVRRPPPREVYEPPRYRRWRSASASASAGGYGGGATAAVVRRRRIGPPRVDTEAAIGVIDPARCVTRLIACGDPRCDICVRLLSPCFCLAIRPRPSPGSIGAAIAADRGFRRSTRSRPTMSAISSAPGNFAPAISTAARPR